MELIWNYKGILLIKGAMVYDNKGNLIAHYWNKTNNYEDYEDRSH